jgi:hypothetical protein
VDDIIIGIFYEFPDGRIVSTFGFNGPKQEISYHFDGGDHLIASYDELRTWKPRRDLKDFPNAIDPRLPHEFDLFYDIKYMSQLKREICHSDGLKKLMQAHGIVCEPKPIDWDEDEEDYSI